MSFQDYLVECEKIIDPNCGLYKVSYPHTFIYVN